MAGKGYVRYDALVTEYWPEFGQNGKEWLTVGDCMQHEAGLSSLSTSIDLDLATTESIKNNYLGKLIEEDTQFWFQQAKQDDPEGAADERSYHAFTRDILANEIFRRVEPSGRTMAEYLREEFPDVGVYSGIAD